MPPKKAGASKKTIEKKKQKVAEDKTFGLKNKKGAKQQKYIEQVHKQVFNKSAAEQKKDKENQAKKSAKDQRKVGGVFWGSKTQGFLAILRPVVRSKSFKGQNLTPFLFQGLLGSIRFYSQTHQN